MDVRENVRRAIDVMTAWTSDSGKSLKPWIIEVNSRPDKSIFNALSDKRMYRKIVSYSRRR
ncbi:hypothetical protein A9X05_26130 [Mycobacterium sp. E3298]|uniref:hypothetical protein n=1 Tax=Mycobacterium sp. E3298 TaxID=1856865 RepID=UPI0007FD58FC|nr:hypothetical protein [Mycobacterium sp. E3298]OBG74226.1 hypothetical protein A9X05_26130 [Mycobacterium sp. E3298]